MLTAVDLKSIMPSAVMQKIELFLPWFNRYMVMYEIDTPARQCCFLANVGHESLSLHYVRELYSGKKYEGRKDLGNIVVGDGVKFRGRGLIQITGRTNYSSCSQAFFGDARLLTSPELLEQPQYAVQSACWFWKDRPLNQISDRVDPALPMSGENLSNFKAVVKRVNGGYNGLDDRIEYWKRAAAIRNSFSASVLPPHGRAQEQDHPSSSNYQKPIR